MKDHVIESHEFDKDVIYDYTALTSIVIPDYTLIITDRNAT